MLRRLEAAFEVVCAGVAVDRPGFESEAGPATEAELAPVAVAVDRPGYESEVEAPVDRELLRPGVEFAAAVFCTAVETRSVGLAVGSAVRMSTDMT